MNKRSVFLSLSLLALGVINAQDKAINIDKAADKSFSISGKIDDKSGSYIYLFYQDVNGKAVRDSAVIQNGEFSFVGTVDGPAQASLLMDRNGRTYDKNTQLYLVPGKMKLKVPYGNFNDLELKGSSVQIEFDELKKLKASTQAKLKPYSDAYNKANNIYIEAIKAKKDEATLESLKAEATKAKDAMDPFYRELRVIEEKYIDEHPSSYVTANILRYSISRMQLKESEARYNKLSDEIKNTSLGKTIKEVIENIRKGSPGATAFQFASKELRGSDLKLTDFRGKYVLVDFWASWCVPCRKGNPHLLSLYSKYKDKGFEIIGVSDDDSKPEAWQKAVDQDKIGVWKHVLRGLKRVDGPEMFDRSNSISDKFGINTLPTKILIDPKGMIIGRYGGGGEDDDAMDKKLSEIFGG